jgi:glyoxylase-like metal-dependent hydrolase (beta-lactamase superfamily II)
VDWFGLPALEILENLSPRVLLIPLHGHSPGHCGVAIEQGDGWLLHCGDATWPFFRSGHPDQPYGDPPQWLVRWLLGAHTPKLRALHASHGDRVEMICSHDPVSFSIHTGQAFAPARAG